MNIFHGSNCIVKSPKILTDGYAKDFGFGFYCTAIESQAKKWAKSKKGPHYVNEFIYKADIEGLNTLRFDAMSEKWLDFVCDCRRGISHSYDIVEGPMADDTIWNYVEDYVRGDISREAFWALAKFKYPTHQIVFCTEKALNSISFKGMKEYE